MNTISSSPPKTNSGRILLFLPAMVTCSLAVTLPSFLLTTVGIAVLVAALFLITLSLLRPSLLPSVSLILFVTPLDYGPIQSLTEIVPPALIPLAIYVWRSRKNLDVSNTTVILASIFLLTSTISAISSAHPVRSLLYFAVFSMSIMAPLLVLPTVEAQRVLTRTWIGTSLVLSLFGFVEWLSQTNPFENWYAHATIPLVQHWDIYRIFTSIGHPLLNGTFFSATFIVAAWQYIAPQYVGRRTSFACALLAAAAMILTGSRSGIVAAALGTASVLTLGGSRITVGVRWAISSLTVGSFMLLYNWLSDTRLGGQEAAESSQVRQVIYANFSVLLKRNELLGVGPGQSEAINQLYGVRPDVALESSILEVLVGFGYLGGMVIVTILFLWSVRTIRNGSRIAPAVLVAVATSSSFFNLLEGQPKGMVLFGLAAILASVPIDSQFRHTEHKRRPPVEDEKACTSDVSH